MKNLENHVALITGGARGLGRSIAEVLTERGINVVLGDINKDKAQIIADSLRENGVRVVPQELDLNNEASMQETVRQALSRFGKIDILVNNTGVDIAKSVFDLAIPEVDKVLNGHLRGTYMMSKLVLSEMARRHEGQIVNVASTMPFTDIRAQRTIRVSRLGLVGLTRALYSEAKLSNCRVSIVVPEGVRAPFTLEQVIPDNYLTRLQDPRNVAEAVYFVLSAPDDSIVTEVMVLPTP